MSKIFKVIFISVFVTSSGTFLFGQVSKSTPKSKMFDATQLLSDLQTLSSDEMEGRSADLPSMQKARDYVEKRLKESGAKPFGGSYKQSFDFTVKGPDRALKGINFIGEIKGKKTDKFIVVTAHYDHDGIVEGEIYNGTDDNASGTAALFSIADYFRKHKPDHSIIFAAFDAEEKGQFGSKYFVQNLPVKKESILLNVNLDMVARGDKGELYVAGLFHYPQFKTILETIQKKGKVKILFGHDDPKLGPGVDWTTASDHMSFHREKIPFIYFGVEDHPDYHKPTDDFEKVPQEFYVKAVETVIETIKKVDGKFFK